MAGASLSNSSSKLNVSQREIVIFQKIILVGRDMAVALRKLAKEYPIAKNTKELEKEWANLMVEFAHMLLQNCET